MSGSQDHDIWTDLPGAAAMVEPAAGGGEGGGIECLPVEPLDAQLGAENVLSTPPALREAMFGPLPGRTPRDAKDEAVLPQTFAVLDASRLLCLPEQLDASGLEHLCLFQGKAEQEMRDVAPWLVRLEEGHELTRKLFTRADGPQHLWDVAPGIFLRSEVSVDRLRRHLRRFIRVRDTDDRWFYFRFWQAQALRAYFSAIAPDDAMRRRWFFDRGEQVVSLLLMPCPAQNEAALAHPFGPAPRAGEPEPQPAFHLRVPEVEAIRNARMSEDLDRLAALLAKSFPETTRELPKEQLRRAATRSTARAFECGIRQKDHLFRFAALDLHGGGSFERADAEGRLEEILRAPLPEGDKMRRLSERLSEIAAASRAPSDSLT